jgi:hypothetical protein
MNLTKIEGSKNIAAVGYLEDLQLLLVQYRDGSLYARLEVESAEFGALMACESKGGFIARMDHDTIAIKRAGPAQAAAPATGRPATTAAPLTADAMRTIQQAVAPTSAADCAFTVLR